MSTVRLHRGVEGASDLQIYSVAQQAFPGDDRPASPSGPDIGRSRASELVELGHMLLAELVTPLVDVGPILVDAVPTLVAFRGQCVSRTGPWSWSNSTRAKLDQHTPGQNCLAQASARTHMCTECWSTSGPRVSVSFQKIDVAKYTAPKLGRRRGPDRPMSLEVMCPAWAHTFGPDSGDVRPKLGEFGGHGPIRARHR